jgi:hypothetical protein
LAAWGILRKIKPKWFAVLVGGGAGSGKGLGRLITG